jgi:hypothetical protein
VTLPLFPSYREIPLTQGQVALVDEADYEWLSQWKWCAQYMASVKGFYAVRGVKKDGKCTSIPMHRFILGLQKGDKLQADHVNRDTLDNRRSNLRSCTRSENNQNKSAQSNNSSGFKGVCFDKRKGKWKAEIKTQGKRMFLGYRDNPKDAHALYVAAAYEHHGSFACTGTNM